MFFGVFIHRSDSIYDDSPSERYQFPPMYLGRVEACIGGWIVYLEPTKVPATRGYFAVAKVQEVIADPAAPGMYLAIVEPGSYLDFADPVPFSGPDGVIERGLLNEAGKISGRAQAAVRPLAPADFCRILPPDWMTRTRFCRGSARRPTTRSTRNRCPSSTSASA